MSSPRALIAGEILVDLFPESALSASDSDSFRRYAGGAPANVAVAMARLGSPPWFWTRMGNDAFGNFLHSKLRSENVPSRFFEWAPGVPTTLTVIDQAQDGGFQFYLDGTATVGFQSGYISDKYLADIEWVHVGGVLFSRESTRTAMFDLIHRASKNGCTVSFDPNMRSVLWSSTEAYVSTLESILASVDVVAGHVDDFPSTYPRDPTSLAATILDLGPHTMYVTKGSEGAELHTSINSPWGAQQLRHDGFNVDVVDTTGAGDAFMAAVIVAHLENGFSPPELMEFANATGALTTTSVGAMTALPDRSTVIEWMEHNSTYVE